MKKILIISNMKKGEGISELVYECYANLSQKPDLLFELATEGQNEFSTELNQLKIKTHTITPFSQHPLQSYKEWKELLRHQYDYVHLHTDNYIRFVPLILMKDHAQQLIIHSHNSLNSYVVKHPFKKALNQIIKKWSLNYQFVRVACSLPAAKWMFDGQSYQLIHNGINLNAYRFSMGARKEMRAVLGLGDDAVLYGHIGRFKEQKNHHKLIEIFNAIHKKQDNARLLLIGDGPLKEEVKDKVAKLGLADKVIFVSYTTEIADYLSAMDRMIFPSYYEGFPISLVEAQASGLSIWYSDTITDEIAILETTHKFSIDEDSTKIAEMILRTPLSSNDRRLEAYEIMLAAGFDLQNSLQKINHLYQ